MGMELDENVWDCQCNISRTVILRWELTSCFVPDVTGVQYKGGEDTEYLQILHTWFGKRMGLIYPNYNEIRSFWQIWTLRAIYKRSVISAREIVMHMRTQVHPVFFIYFKLSPTVARNEKKIRHIDVTIKSCNNDI